MSISNLYEAFFKNILQEDNFAGSGGALGASGEIYSPDNPVSADKYAPGDARNIFNNKIVIQRRAGGVSKRKKGRKRRKK